ncbi:MAG: TonB-dependent receptor [Amphiplicatus sp.]|nr:TonB-dependent receptor [Amphiplicatus sp.]MCB9956932.1 TonB-dependent receptor [Caulobacterales bacterium]HRX38022.1 TonB-dependent receptor [Parvularculaceae bacterium]
MSLLEGNNKISRKMSAAKRVMLLAGASLSAVLTSGLASQASAQDEESLMGDRIVVTARKRAESLQEVPISISTVSAAQIERLNATSLKDLKNFIPSLHYSDRSALQTQITIRGVGGDSRNIGIESGIGLYVDGVFAGRTSGYNMDLADIEQIEVLRGPQGTLFGKNTTGGAINIVTRKPSDELHANATLGYGNYDAVRFKGSVSGPISDTVSLGVTFASWDRDGYIKNIYDKTKLQSEERRAGLVQLRFQPNDKWDILLSGDATFDDQKAILNQLGSNAAFGAGYYIPDRFYVNTDQQNSIERDMYGASLSAEYRFDSGLTFTSISAFRSVDITVHSDIDQTPVDIFRSGPFTDDADQYTQELRLTSPDGQFFEYMAGFYFYRQEAQASRRIYSAGNPLFFTDGPIDTTSYAGFANATANFTDKLSITGGVRVTYEKKEGSYEQTSTVAPFNKSFPELEISVTKPSWTASLNYLWTDDVSTYFTASNGFKSGGFNVDPLATPAPLSADDITFDPEFVTSYEVGFKSDTFDGKLRFTAAAFYATYTDRQVPQFESIGGVPTVITRNAGESEVYGGEVEFTASPSPWLLVYGGASYLHGEYTEFAGATTGGADYTGNVTENTPKWTVNLGAELRAPVGPGEVTLSPNFAYVGETFLQPDNGPFNYEDGYAVFNARAGYEFQDGRYGIYLWGKNLTDAEYKEFARQFNGSDQVLFGEPRTYGVEVSARF